MSSACSRTSRRLVGPAFGADGDAILLVGEATPGLAGSEYARLAGVAAEDGPPTLDLALEASVQAFVREAAERGLLASAQDVAAGGLAVALAEMRDVGRRRTGLGARVRLPVANSPAVDLFGESPSADRRSRRRLATPRRSSCSPATTASRSRSSAAVGGDRLVIELAGSGATGAAEERGSRVADALDVPLADLRHAWETGLSRALGWEGR